MLKEIAAKAEIISSWQRWRRRCDQTASDDMRSYFFWLQRHKPYLLDFRGSSQDKWPMVRVWLCEYEQKWNRRPLRRRWS